MKGGGGIIPVAVLLLLVLILSGAEQITAAQTTGLSFRICAIKCIIFCYIGSEVMVPCAMACLKSCHKSDLNMLDYCNLGCSIDRCIHFGRDVDAVKSCVDGCEKSTCNIKIPLK